MIYVLFDTSVTEEERQAVVRTVEDTRPLFPGFWMETVAPGKTAEEEKIRKNMDSYIEGTQTENGRYDALIVLRRLESLAERRKDAEAVLLFTGRDLCLSSQGISWCFGAGRVKAHTAVCSVIRYRKLTEQERLRCIRRTMRHEIGHILGLAADSGRKNTEEHSGPHCTAPGCSMRQAGTLEKLLAFSLEEDRQGWCFCPDCLAELEAARKRLTGKRRD